MKNTDNEERVSPMERIAALIVDRRKAFYFLYIGLAIFCLFSRNWVQVNDDLSSYLPAETETRRGLAVMEEQFTTFGTSRIAVDNLPLDQAEALKERLEAVSGVRSVDFDGAPEDYVDGTALFTITYDGGAEDPVSLAALERVEELLGAFDLYVTGDTGNSDSASLAAEMGVVMAVAAAIILLVLLFTSQTYMEIPVLVATFGMAALLNMGTNFLLGEISFISHSVAVVLQLALAIDYAIILCRRYTEEREHLDARDAVVTALSKAIPEISGSSLTTLSGLGAMCFMRFGIGMDLGVVMMKAILLSLLSVFTLMPGLLMSFSGLIDRTHHRNFVPKITLLGRFAVATRFFMPPLFVISLGLAFFLSSRCPYVYGMSGLSTIRVSEKQIAQEKVESTFGGENRLAVLVPAGDYGKEGRLLAELEGMEGVESAMGLANIEAMDGWVLTDRLTPRQFAELADLDIEAARLLYSAYALDQGSYGQILSGLDGFGVPLIDMFLFVHDGMERGSIQLGNDVGEKLDELAEKLSDAKVQLAGTDYSRLILNLSLPEEGRETFDFLTAAGEAAARYYPEGSILVGNSTSDRDLSASFEQDNLLISILTAVFVVLVLVFTFQSAGLPVLLIVVIQGSVWMNFSFPYLTNTPLFFLSYLVVSSIQMGANIDYAIVIAGRYTELKKAMRPKDAVVEALNEAFPTIVTSGTILAAAGALIGVLSTNPSISSIGICLGRGTAISIFLVLFILPQILLLGDAIIEKTSFALKTPAALQLQRHAGTLLVDGRIRGYVSGIVDAEFNGLLRGTIDASVSGGTVTLTSPEGAEYAKRPAHPAPAPVPKTPPVPETAPVPKAPPVPETAPVPKAPPVQSAAPVQEAAPAQQAPPVPTAPSVPEAAPIPREKPVPEAVSVSEAVPVVEAAPVAEKKPVPETESVPETAPVPETESVPETAPVPETEPVPETADSAAAWEQQAGFDETAESAKDAHWVEDPRFEAFFRRGEDTKVKPERKPGRFGRFGRHGRKGKDDRKGGAEE